MFKMSDKVICINDKNPNPNSEYPRGYVVCGSIYCVRGIGYDTGLQIVGKPVIGKQTGLDAGWRADRFRKLNDIGPENMATISTAVTKSLIASSINSGRGQV